MLYEVITDVTSRRDIVGHVGNGDEKAVAPPVANEADRIVEIPGILPVDRDERHLPLVDTRKPIRFASLPRITSYNVCYTKLLRTRP